MPLIYNGQKMAPIVVSDKVKTQVKTAIPSQEQQEVISDPNTYLSKVIIEPIPSEYVIPSGTLTIRANGSYNVKDYAEVTAELTPVLISIPIDKNRWVIDDNLFGYTHHATVNVNLGNLNTSSILTLIYDNESEGLFNQYCFYCSNATDKSITIHSIDRPLEDIILKVEIIYNKGENGTPTIISPTAEIKKNVFLEFISGNLANIGKDLISGITTLRDYAFYSCANLISIEIPDSIAKLENQVFYGCPNLTTVKLPTTVTVIRANAFTGCSKLVNINLENVEQLSAQPFNSCTSLKEIDLSSTITITNSAFSGCTSLEKVIIGEKLSSIGATTFSGCSSLNTVIYNKICSVASDVPTLPQANTIPLQAIIYVKDTTTQTLLQNATNWGSHTIKLQSELET